MRTTLQPLTCWTAGAASITQLAGPTVVPAQTWGWEPSGSLCAFKDDQQLPIPPQRSYTMLSWLEAPACKEAPTPTAANAAADRFGCLWGWQLERNCAYRDIAGRPLYYQGYKGACDSAGSAKRAAEFNAKAAGDDT